MQQEGDKISGDKNFLSKQALVTIIVCTALSLFFMRTGILTFIDLVPLGYAVIVSGSFLYTFFAAALANIALFIFFSGKFGIIWIDILYLTALFLMYTWIVGGKNIRTAYRIILASSAGAVFFLYTVYRMDSVFFSLFYDVANELFPGIVTLEVMEAVKNILFRGGALVSMLFLFFINRQLAISAVWLIKRQRNDRGLTGFFAPFGAIWVFSGALATIILAGMFAIEVLEILAWNVFIICAIIYLAQGAGILIHFLALRSPAFRICSIILLIVLLFSPLTIVVIAALLLLGIIENWRPLRRT
ncbi:MAG: hypothetical protein LBG94_07450 [Treponema sp.]|jgi:hypothetical protein|nr:hypothetical protein [Treponema sp.]